MNQSTINDKVQVYTNSNYCMVTPAEARKIQAAKLRWRIIHLQKRLDLLLNNDCKKHGSREPW